MPDVKARLQAIQLLLSESLGKAPTAPELPSAQLPTNVAAVKAMDWETMQQVFAALYVDEVAVAVREGGHALLREKLNTLSEGEQRVLREALTETAA
jgi:hypothetical protein